MIDAVLRAAIERRGVVLVLVLAFAGLGVWNYRQLPIDAVPDITNVQVQINTEARGYSPLETEQRVTFPIETVMAGLPRIDNTRSVSRYGLSQVTVVFKDGTDIYFARNLINERLQQVRDQLPAGLTPVMGPTATGLGEIFFYTVKARTAARQADGSPYSLTDLRGIHDWIIAPQLRRVPGVTEINPIGGYQKQFVVSPDPVKLLSYGLTLGSVVDALERNNANVGAGYIERRGEQYLIRVPGQVSSTQDLRHVILTQRAGVPITVGDVAQVSIGQELRTGAATRDGEETVIGTAVMLIGENSRAVAKAVAAKLKEVAHTLPAGVTAEPIYDRTTLVERTIGTVQKNLIEGAILVVVVLLVLLGNVRAALITAAVIPLAMLLTITGMVEAGVSANLMSLGALDFGLIVDGAVIIVENCIAHLAEAQHRHNRALTTEERFHTVFAACRQVFRPSLVSVVVVILVNLPILALSGVEGKMFRPMAFTVITALLGALALSLTFVPAAVALLIRGRVAERENLAIRLAKRAFEPVLQAALRYRMMLIVGAVVLVGASLWLATRMGREFIPNLDEGDVAVEISRIPGTGLAQSIMMQQAIERAVDKVPEVVTMFARIGTAEVATDPQAPGVADTVIMLKPRAQWPDPAKPKSTLIAELARAIDSVPGSSYAMSQPIQLRFNELISGVRADVAVKVFGDNLEELLTTGNRIAALIGRLPGAADVKVEQLAGLPFLSIEPNPSTLHRYGLNVGDLQDTVVTALGGREAGLIFEGDRRSDIVVRLSEAVRSDPTAIERLPIALPGGGYVPLSEIAALKLVNGPNQISRENGKRRVVVTVNVRGRDLGSFVTAAKQTISGRISLPPGYWIDYGGTFEQLQSASARLRVLVPATLVAVFGLLLLTFGSAKEALLVFASVPLALTGGVVALWLRGIPLSISAGVGFITLSGVAVLTGVVMVSAFSELRRDGLSAHEAVVSGTLGRLRPILMIALVASLGFLPMALNTGTGAEVQRPLATVVIGGILSATVLTLLVLPALYVLTMNTAASPPQVPTGEDHTANP